MNTFGFSLIEILIGITLIATFSFLTFSDGTASYVRGLSRADRSTIISALYEARNRSLAGTCEGSLCLAGAAHGVFLSSNYLTLFEGSAYADRDISEDERIPFSNVEKITDTDSENQVVFGSGSADVATTTSLQITGADGRTQSFLINSQGGITTTLMSAATTQIF